MMVKKKRPNHLEFSRCETTRLSGVTRTPPRKKEEKKGYTHTEYCGTKKEKG